MTLWEDVLERNPQFQETLHDLDAAVVGYQQQASTDFGYVDELEFQARYLDIARDPHTAPGGLYGYGLWFGGGATAVPSVFVQPGLAPAGGAPIGASPFARVARQFEWPARVLAVALPPPQFQSTALRQSVAPNTKVTVGSQRATLGLPVSTDSCPTGYTTAGHAAPTTPVTVRDTAGDKVGDINVAINLDNGPVDQSTADVALVELADDCPEQLASVSLWLDAARVIDNVSILGLSSAASYVRGLSPALAFQPGIAQWGEVAITADAISSQGDSGSLVVRSDGAVLGQIVAGYPGVYSLVQDIEYCLKALGAQLR